MQWHPESLFKFHCGRDINSIIPKTMSVKSAVVKHTESSSLLAAGRKSYTYVQISETPISSSPNRVCRICDERGPLCRCEHNLESTNNKDDKISPPRHKFAQGLLLLITFFLTVAIIGSALLLSHFKVPTAADHRNPLMMSVFLDNESTSRFEVVDNTVDIVKGKRIKRVLASGTYIRNAEGGGWNHLTVRAGEGFSSSPSNREYSQETSLNYIRSMEAAGYLEGYATCMEIGQYYVNFYFGLFDGGDPTQGSLEFLEDNYDWMASEAEKNWDVSVKEVLCLFRIMNIRKMLNLIKVRLMKMYVTYSILHTILIII